MSDRKSDHITERKPRRMNPRSLANLRPPWKKGDVPNPQGRPSAGGAVKEFLNAMQELTKEEVQAIIEDPNQPVNRVAAARLWFSACEDSHDLTVLMDRTDGKPKETLDVQGRLAHVHVIKPAMARLKGHPKAFEAAKALRRELMSIDDDHARN